MDADYLIKLMQQIIITNNRGCIIDCCGGRRPPLLFCLSKKTCSHVLMSFKKTLLCFVQQLIKLRLQFFTLWQIELVTCHKQLIGYTLQGILH